MSANSGPDFAAMSVETTPETSSFSITKDDANVADKRAGADRIIRALIALLVICGSLGLAPQWISLWDTWNSDPLRSIGLLVVIASFMLTLRVWRQCNWELRGSWWGMLPIVAACCSNIFARDFILSWGTGPDTVNFLPRVLPIYFYFSGVVLLFAGSRVWRQAWFPLALLLCAQPVPAIFVHLFDLPLQHFAASVARSFAKLIGFAPSNEEQLRLMFSPDFGMFIAPGCDGMRGSVTLGYVALIAGYLKRVSIPRWIAYVVGAVFLGHVFNLIRLCGLVLYYRIALGHPSLEGVAEQADYVIGGTLILSAAILFLWIVIVKEPNPRPGAKSTVSPATALPESRTSLYLKAGAFAVLGILAGIPGVRAIELNRNSVAGTESSGNLSPAQLDARVPDQIGAYKVARKWQSQIDGDTVMESAAYSMPGSDEITLGIWLRVSGHNVHESLMTHGETAEMQSKVDFITVGQKVVPFDTAFYSDGIDYKLAGNTYCSPATCLAEIKNESGIRLEFKNDTDFMTRGVRMVPIFFIVEQPANEAAHDAAYKDMLIKARNFIAGADLIEISRRYQ
jgi:exosortase J